jgi:hypothetical protein
MLLVTYTWLGCVSDIQMHDVSVSRPVKFIWRREEAGAYNSVSRVTKTRVEA